jgi:hypothetical protein
MQAAHLGHLHTQALAYMVEGHLKAVHKAALQGGRGRGSDTGRRVETISRVGCM